MALYVNDLFECPGLDDISMLMYADDTVIFLSDTNQADAMGKLQDSFDIVLEWCSQNKLTLNTQNFDARCHGKTTR